MLIQPNLARLKRRVRSPDYGLCAEEISIVNSRILTENKYFSKASGEFEAQNFVVAGLRDAVGYGGVDPSRFIRNAIVRAAVEEMIATAEKDAVFISIQGYTKRGAAEDSEWEFNPDEPWSHSICVREPGVFFYVLSKLSANKRFTKQGGRLELHFVTLRDAWELLGSVYFDPNKNPVLTGQITKEISPYVERAKHILEAIGADCATEPASKIHRIDTEESKEEGEL